VGAERRLRILHTIAGLWEGTGGPVASVTSLCRALAQGHDVCLLTGDGPLHPDVRRLEGSVRLRVERLGPYKLAHWSPHFAAACREEAARADVVHDHGVWLHTNWASAAAARDARRPLVRSPRGMLSPWALSRSRLRKRLLWSLRESRLIDGATVHATSGLEERELRALGVTAPIAVIGNGVDTEGEYSASRIEAAYKLVEGQGRKRVVFLARLHPKKGLDLLQQAWAALPRDAAVDLVVAGDADKASTNALTSWTKTQLGPPARYIGSVEGQEKLRLLSGAFVLVLPSRSENYGMAVAEALAAGTPVITTTATPWTDLDGRGCGWTIEPTLPALAAALQRALTIDDNAHAAMRQNARRYIEAEHSLAATTARFESLYASLIRNDS
jgi:glycosyltransferase involved in cell wall biosynthesis